MLAGGNFFLTSPRRSVLDKEGRLGAGVGEGGGGLPLAVEAARGGDQLRPNLSLSPSRLPR